MKLLKNPLVAAALALVFGTATGAYWFMRLASTAITAHAPLVEGGAPLNVSTEVPWGFWTVELDNLASDLKEEKARLQKRQELVEQRETRLLAEQAELEKLRKELEAMRGEISQKIVEISTDETKNLRSLAQTYSALTPKALVSVFKEMDDTTTVKILSLMKTEVVAPVFEEMSKSAGADTSLAKRVAALSEKLRLLKAAKTK